MASRILNGAEIWKPVPSQKALNFCLNDRFQDMTLMTNIWDLSLELLSLTLMPIKHHAGRICRDASSDGNLYLLTLCQSLRICHGGKNKSCLMVKQALFLWGKRPFSYLIFGLVRSLQAEWEVTLPAKAMCIISLSEDELNCIEINWMDFGSRCTHACYCMILVPEEWPVLSSFAFWCLTTAVQ